MERQQLQPIIDSKRFGTKIKQIGLPLPHSWATTRCQKRVVDNRHVEICFHYLLHQQYCSHSLVSQEANATGLPDAADHFCSFSNMNCGDTLSSACTVTFLDSTLQSIDSTPSIFPRIRLTAFAHPSLWSDTNKERNANNEIQEMEVREEGRSQVVCLTVRVTLTMSFQHRIEFPPSLLFDCLGSWFCLTCIRAWERRVRSFGTFGIALKDEVRQAGW